MTPVAIPDEILSENLMMKLRCPWLLRYVYLFELCLSSIKRDRPPVCQPGDKAILQHLREAKLRRPRDCLLVFFGAFQLFQQQFFLPDNPVGHQ